MGSLRLVPGGSTDRMHSIDAVRGLAMVVMALDHVRDFFHADSLVYDPTDLDVATPAVFLTRWVTNFCAPAFVFLAGVGAYLWAEHGKTRRELCWFLLSRGVWLVFLELTVIRCLGWYFNFNYYDTRGTVIWAIGWSMVVLGGLIWLPWWAIAATSFILIGGHNLLDPIKARHLDSFAWLWRILHAGGVIEFLPGRSFWAIYPLLPWIGVMAGGYVCGQWISPRCPYRLRFFTAAGLLLTLAFLLLRALNVYGDPEAWSIKGNTLYTVFSFIDCAKYPPSLLFLLMTLGPTFLLLALFEHIDGIGVDFLAMFGRVPLFYYVLHLTLIHGLAVLFSLARYGRADWLFVLPPGWSEEGYPEGYGYSLPVVYAVYALVLLLLWPACSWFARLKERKHVWWMSYL